MASYAVPGAAASVVPGDEDDEKEVKEREKDDDDNDDAEDEDEDDDDDQIFDVERTQRVLSAQQNAKKSFSQKLDIPSVGDIAGRRRMSSFGHGGGPRASATAQHQKRHDSFSETAEAAAAAQKEISRVKDSVASWRIR